LAGCRSTYTDAPAASAARPAITSVICSNPPPWMAMNPNRDRSVLSSMIP
jgi:hypothetical protein